MQLDINARVAVLESRYQELDNEVTWTRQRLDALEQERASISVLMNEIGQFPRRMKEISEATARTTVDLVLKERDGLTLSRDEQRRENVKLKISGAMLGVATGGLGVSLLLHYLG